MNRYSRASTSRFNPMSMQEIFSVPLSKQNQHDQMQAQADELGLFDIKSLDIDEDLKNEYIGGFQKEMDNVSSRLMSSGMDNSVKQRLKKLALQRNEWLTKGQGAHIQKNYNEYDTNKKELDKLYETGKITRDKYMLGLQQALKNYKGVGEDDTYSPFTAVQDTDFEKKATEIAKAINQNPKKITQFSGLQYDDRTGKFVDVKTKREFTREGAIRQAVRAGLMMDGEIMSDLNQRQDLGMFGDTSVEKYIDGLGLFNELIYAKDNVDYTKQHIGTDHKQLDKVKEENQSNYELGADRTLALRTEKLSSKLSDIIEERNNPTNGTGVDLVETENGLAIGPATVRSTYNSLLKDFEKEEYDVLYKKLQESGAIGKDYDKESPEAMGAIKNYLDAFENFTYQPVKHTDGLIKTYSNSGSKFKRATPKELSDAISNNPEDRWFWDTKNKEEVKFEDLPKEHREQLMKGNGKVVASHGARNDYKNEFRGIAVDQKVFAGLLELQLGDNHKYLVSRSSGEMNTPEYKNDQQVNKIWSDLVRTPHLPNTFDIPGLGKVKMTRLSNGSTTVNINGKDYDSLKSDANLERFIKEAYKN